MTMSDPDGDESGDDAGDQIRHRDQDLAGVEHAVQLELERRERGESAAEAGSDQGASPGGFAPEAWVGDDVAEQQAAHDIRREGRPRPAPDVQWDRLAQTQARERAGGAAGEHGAEQHGLGWTICVTRRHRAI